LWHSLLADARFHALLLEADQEVAAKTRARGCPQCGGALHAAHFARKPRGGPSLPEEYDTRLSFCCATDGCRKRCTPPSLRFLGRRVYFATVVVIVSVLRHGPTPTRVRRLQELVGMSRRTVERWCQWWRDAFTHLPLWRAGAARFVPPVAQRDLPKSLLERFAGDEPSQLLALLRWLGPVTGGANSQAY
jgi:hypothetical protein